MNDKNEIFCFIPAKSNSSRLKNKNIKVLGGKPLLERVIETAKKSKIFKEYIYISTDCENISEIAKNANAKVPQLRPEYLTQDPYGVKDVLLDFLDKNTHLKLFKYVAIILPTAPLIAKDDIQNAFKLVKKENVNTLISVTENDHSAFRSLTIDKGEINPIFPDLIPKKSQDLETTYRINGAIIIQSVNYFLKHKTYLKNPMIPFIMPRDRSIDIDTLNDFNLAEYYLEKKKK